MKETATMGEKCYTLLWLMVWKFKGQKAYLVIITNNGYVVMRCKNFQKTVLHGACVLKLVNYYGFPGILALLEDLLLERKNNSQNLTKGWPTK